MTSSDGSPPREPSPASPGRSLFDQALDMVLYAPVGLLLTAAEDLPEWVDKGRRRVEAQLSVARTVGRLAVGEGQRRAEGLVRRVVGPNPAPHAPAPAQPPSPAGASSP
ncbi:MAG: hypothetical protein ACRD0J_00990, partial [Acidimicrobiales bacterium]